MKKVSFKEMHGYSKRQYANAYRAGAKYLEEHNWTRGRLHGPGDTHCALGAYQMANEKVLGPKTSCYLAEEKVLGICLVGFNDGVAKSKDEVVKAMRKIARDLDHGLQV